MNALQQLIADYLADNPQENYASIARRGSTIDHMFRRQTVQSLATTPRQKQTPYMKTLLALARGMNMSPTVVKRAAADAAGYKNDMPNHADNGPGRIVVEATIVLDAERLDVLARRARSLLAEMEEEAQRKQERGGK